MKKILLVLLVSLGINKEVFDSIEMKISSYKAELVSTIVSWKAELVSDIEDQFNEIEFYEIRDTWNEIKNDWNNTTELLEIPPFILFSLIQIVWISLIKIIYFLWMIIVIFITIYITIVFNSQIAGVFRDILDLINNLLVFFK